MLGRIPSLALLISLAGISCGISPDLQVQRASGEAIATITYHSPRLPLHSDRFELSSGTFVPSSDGPTGDLDFFFDGKRFFIAVNQGGGAQRAIAPMGEPQSLGSGPMAVREGDAFRIKTPQGMAQVVITRLATGSLHLTPQSAGGEGQVSFNYQSPG